MKKILYRLFCLLLCSVLLVGMVPTVALTALAQSVASAEQAPKESADATEPPVPEDCSHGSDADTCTLCAMEASIAALPTLEELQQLEEAGYGAALEEIRSLYDAYLALTEEEQAQVSNGDILTALGDALFADIVTRAQWLQRLVQTFEMTVEDEKYPDNYFSDLSSDSEYYYDILLAVEFGVIDIPAGGEVRPDDPATREFAAQTLNFCLGYEFEEDSYTFTDADLCTYPAAGQIAVNLGWLELLDGAFCPEATITAEEMETMIAYALAVLESETIDTEFESAYVFADHVKVFNPGQADFEISHDGAGNQVLTFYSADELLNAGDTFVIYHGAMPSLYKAAAVSGNTDRMTVTTTEADESTAIVSINAQGLAEMDLSGFEANEGATAIFIENDADVAMAKNTYGISVNKGAVLVEEDFELDNGIEISLVASISNLKLNHKIDTWDNYYYVTVSGDTSLTGVASKSIDHSEVLDSTTFPLGTVSVAGIGRVTIFAEFSLAGSITMTRTDHFEVGIERDDGNFRRVVSFNKKSFTCVIEATASMGLKAEFAVSIIAAKASFYTKTGISSKIVMATYDDGYTPETCLNINGWLYLDVGVSASIGVGKLSKSWSRNFSIYNINNSPVRVYFHYEDGARVYECSRDSEDYCTKSDSSLGDSSYEDSVSGGSSVGVDSSGQEMVIYTYTVDSYGNATITGYKGAASALVIPSRLDGYTVTAIGNSAFRNNAVLYAVVLPSTCTKIGDYAFCGCTNLQIVQMPSSLNSIGTYAFSGCKKITSLSVPGNVSSIGSYAFEGCTSLVSLTLPHIANFHLGVLFCRNTSYSTLSGYISTYNYWFVPASLTKVTITGGSSVYSGAFMNCSGLTEVTLPEGITAINSSAFSGCSSLASANIPSSVTTIGTSAFAGCSKIQKLKLPAGLKTIGSHAFNACSSAFTGALEIPDTVTSVGEYAFKDCTGITDITVPSSDTALESYIFNGCTNLKSLTLPHISNFHLGELFCRNTTVGSIIGYDYTYNGHFIPASLRKVTITGGSGIYSSAFYGCNFLTEINLPENITSIGSSAFSGCSSLASVNIPSTVTSIGNYAFSGCSKIQQLSLPADLKTIDTHAFSGCSSAFTGALEIPDTVTSVGEYAFKDCTGITDITVPSTDTALADYSFNGCIALESLTLPHISNFHLGELFCRNTTVGSIIGYDYTYNGHFIPASLRKVTITGGSGIYSSAFYGCNFLTEINLPENITSIGSSAFSGCSSLASVNIPSTVTSIGNYAFSGCTKLSEILFQGDAPSIASSAFSNVTADVFYPAGNATYTDSVTVDYGGRLNWQPSCCNGHDEVITVAKAPTCTEPGLTEGRHCSACGEVILAQEAIPATGHTPVADEAREAACTESGLTAGSHCESCGEILTAQETIDALGHDEIAHEAKTPTCTEAGWRDYVTCSRCDYTTYVEIPAPGHTEIIDAAVAPTCTESGLTEGRHCEVCGEILLAQEVLPAAHVSVILEGKAPSCTESGLTEGRQCGLCGEILAAQEIIEATGHTPVSDEAVPPTCTETGLTEGAHCSVCGEILEARQSLPAAGHSFGDWTADADGTERRDCETCGHYETREAETGTPAAPVITVANVSSSGKPEIRWDAVTGAVKYRIYRKASGGSYARLADVTATAYTDTSAAAGTKYYYKVRSFGANSDYSDYSNVKTSTCDLARPTVTLSNEASSGKIKISWEKISGTKKYSIYRSTSKTGTFAYLDGTVSTAYIDTTAEAGTRYYYKIRAVHATSAATSAYSSGKSLVCDLARPAVTLANDASSGKIKLTWSAIEDIRKYSIYRSDSKSGTYAYLDSTTSTAYIDTSAEPGTRYYYKVRAIHTTSSATSAYSSAKSLLCDLKRPSMTLTLSSAGYPYLRWTVDEEAEKYYVYRATSKSNSYTRIGTSTTGKYVDKTASAGKTYYYKIKAIHADTSANSAYSAIKSIKAK